MSDTIYSMIRRLGHDFFGPVQAASCALVIASVASTGCAGTAASTPTHISPEVTCGSIAECKQLGARARFGIGQPEDASTALAYYAMACAPNSSEPAACLIAGELSSSSEGGEPDLVSAEVYLRRACEVGSDQDCYDAGTILSRFSADAAMQPFGRACNAGLAHGCTELGVLTGLVLKDESQSRVLLQRGCSGGDPIACKIIGSKRPVASVE